MSDKSEIKKYCNEHLYSDVNPYEVIETKKNGRVVVRLMDSELVKSPVQHAGGFLAHTENHTQKWECKSNEANHTKELRYSKARGHWYEVGAGGRYFMNDNPIKFYDYNF